MKGVSLFIIFMYFFCVTGCDSLTGSDKKTDDAPKTGTISGYAASNQGYNVAQAVAVKNVLVTTNPGSSSTYTESSGYYSISNLLLGTYNVTFSKEPFYANKTIQINLNSSLNQSNVTLDLINSKVSFSIDVSLTGRSVTFYIDDQLVGTGQYGYSVPSKILPVGNHKFYATSGNSYWGPTTKYVQVEEYFWSITN